jgi:hypothetical protein
MDNLGTELDGDVESKAAGMFDSLETRVDTVVEATVTWKEPDQETKVNRGMEAKAARKETRPVFRQHVGRSRDSRGQQPCS